MASRYSWAGGLRKLPVSLFALVVSGLLFVGDADARSVRVDDTLQEFQVAGPLAPDNSLDNNGSSGPIAIQSYNLLPPDGAIDFGNPLDFSLSIFGTTYDSYYINENGSISFGGAFGGRPGNSDPTMAGIPIFAPFFADVDSTLSPFGGSIAYGFFPEINGIAITWSSMGPLGSVDPGQRQDLQIVIIDISSTTGNAGDFRLEFNYAGGSEGMIWETGNDDGGTDGLGGNSARVGFWDGFGLGYEIDGSGINGALLGVDCEGNPTALDCNNYFYEFRGGTPFTLDGTPLVDTPEPEIALLLMAGFGAIRWSRRRLKPRA